MALIRSGNKQTKEAITDIINGMTSGANHTASVTIDVTNIDHIKWKLTGKTGGDNNTSVKCSGALSYNQVVYNVAIGTEYTIDCSNATGILQLSVGYITIEFIEIQ